MQTSRSCLFTSLALCVFATGAWAQTPDPVPLKNWAAPLSWQPTTEPELAVAREKAAGQSGTNPDVAAYSGARELGMLAAITPCRLVDTRYDMPTPYGSGSLTPLVWTAGSTHSIPAAGLPSGTYSGIANPCAGLPVAEAYSANITVWPQPVGTILNWLSVCPTGTATATCSATAALTGYEGGTTGTAGIISNGAVIPANASGSFDVYVTNSTYVIIDINGYYLPASALALGAGTASSPALTFSNDATSGLYSPAAGTVDITASGNAILTVNSGGTSVSGSEQVSGNLTVGTGIIQSSAGTIIRAPSDGYYNSGLGIGALASISYGMENAAVGFDALQSNVGGSASTAVGAYALQNDNHPDGITAIGDRAMQSATAEVMDDTAVGTEALMRDTTGNFNTALGSGSMAFNTTGGENTAVGDSALYENTTGTYNIAIGERAGFNVAATNSNNIHIGTEGASGDNNTIRIGGNTSLGDNSTQSQFFASGIYGTNVSGSAVYVTSNGQLGVQSSSRRYKQDIRDMGDTTAVLMGLRPVEFRYKAEGAAGPEHYGLIAEEVAEVAPELVGRGQDGQIDSVHYEKVNAMLLNQMQTQQRQIEEQKAQLRSQREELTVRLKAQDDLIHELESRLAEVEGQEK